jgi:hypothetical protein
MIKADLEEAELIMKTNSSFMLQLYESPFTSKVCDFHVVMM